MKKIEKKILINTFVISILLLLVMLFCSIKSRVSVKIYAATAFEPKAKSIINKINEEKGDKLVVFGTSTDNAFKKIVKNKADIAIVSSPSELQKELLEKSKDDVVFEKLYDEPLAFYVNKNNPIDEIRSEQIIEIYSGDYSWDRYGWSENKDKIVTYQLEEGNGSQTAFENFFVKDNKLDENHMEVKYMNSIMEKVVENKNGIAYAFNSYYNDMYEIFKSKIIKVDGYYPDDDNYSIKTDVYIVYKAKNKEKLDDIITAIITYKDIK